MTALTVQCNPAITFALCAFSTTDGGKGIVENKPLETELDWVAGSCASAKRILESNLPLNFIPDVKSLLIKMHDKERGVDEIIDLILQAGFAIKNANPKVFIIESNESKYNGKEISTWEFLDLVSDTACSIDDLGLNADHIIENINPEGRSEGQRELLGNRELLQAAIDSFLKLENAGELLDFIVDLKEIKSKASITPGLFKIHEAIEILIQAVEDYFPVKDKEEAKAFWYSDWGFCCVNFAIMPDEYIVNFASKLVTQIYQFSTVIPNLEKARTMIPDFVSDLREEFQSKGQNVGKVIDDVEKLYQNWFCKKRRKVK